MVETFRKLGCLRGNTTLAAEKIRFITISMQNGGERANPHNDLFKK